MSEVDSRWGREIEKRYVFSSREVISINNLSNNLVNIRRWINVEC